MVMSNCAYNCSAHPAEIQPDPDITGTGVLISYTATAGIVVVIVVLHYTLAYRPDLDPFRRDDDKSQSSQIPQYRPNPVDMMILRTIRRVPRHHTAVYGFDHWRWSNLDSAFMKCVLAMSDLQLATGVSILISGYSQLRCGLSCFHWKIVGRLAWFSSLTHLSCLTLLRNYLHNRPAERQWRLVAMVVLVIMLLTAMFPTGNYTWSETRDSIQPADYAICHLFTTLRTKTYTFVGLMVSLLLIILGLVIRIFKLHRALALGLVGNGRRSLSKGARKLLWVIYSWREASDPSRRRTGKILYPPVLALFLALRAILDHWSSMFFEVLWLLFSFVYGLSSLLHDLNILNSVPEWNSHRLDSPSWSFGQIMAVILLAVPLITILEILYPEAKKNRPLSPVLSLSSLAEHDNQVNSTPMATGIHTMEITTSSQNDLPVLDPDQDYYRHSSSLTAGTIYITIAEFGIGSSFLAFNIVGYSATVVKTAFWACRAILPLVAFSLWAVILISFFIDWAFARRIASPRLLMLLHAVNLLLFLCFPVLPTIGLLSS